MEIRQLHEDDLGEWSRLRLALWPDAEEEELAEEMAVFLPGGDPRVLCLVAQKSGGGLCGLLELQLRAVAEGCYSSPVAHVENWFVDGEYRRQGVATSLLEQGAAWARRRGCAEISSSCVFENEVGQTVHEALDFEEADRLVHYVYLLEAEG